jgi:hypothetical protein
MLFLKARLLLDKSPPAFDEKPACFLLKARLLFKNLIST